MTVGTLKTQGTELWTIDTLSSSEPAVLKFACPTGLTGIGSGAADQLEDTCLDELSAKTYKRGLGNPGTISVPFNFIPSNGSHQILFELKSDGRNLSWLVGLSDGTAAPTLDTDDTFIAPASRTSIEFEAYVSDVAIDFATNEIVRGTLTLQQSGDAIPHWNGPVPA